ncbi:MAG: LEPR-XLL domain-containing protein, partial [Sulfitobacter sp.]
MSAPFRQIPTGSLPALPINRRSSRRLKKRDVSRFYAMEKAARSLLLDPLEPRVLLNADVLALDLTTMYQDNRDHELLVQLHEDVQEAESGATSVQRVQIVDRAGGAVLAFGDLSEITGVSILGGGGNDAFVIDAASFGDTTPFTFNIDGGGGVDSVVFDTDRNTSWVIGDSSEGTANDGFVTVDFAGVEWAIGAEDNEDEFIISPTGSMVGIDGGAGGFDTLILSEGHYNSIEYQAIDANSGTIIRDGDVLSFLGLEPVQQLATVDHFTVNLIPNSAPFLTGTATLDAGSLVGSSFDIVVDGANLERYELNAPTDSLTVLSSNALVDPVITLNINSWSDAFTGDLIVETEVINVAAGVSIGSDAAKLSSVKLHASDSANDGSLTALNLIGSGTVSSAVDVQGSIYATGEVSLSATAERIADATGDFSIFSPSGAIPLQMPTLEATATVGSASRIVAGAFGLTATTNLDISVDAGQSVLGSFTQNILADTTTHATVQSGAIVEIGSDTLSGESVSGLVRAEDT